MLIPDGRVNVLLPSGGNVELPVFHPKFHLWKGPKIDFDFGGKPVIEYEGEPVFAELAILRMLIADGWDGVWVETYGGMHFLHDMPQDWKLAQQHVDIPTEKREMILQIQKAGGTIACFDVFAWKGDEILFCEAKNKGKDKLTSGQLKFIEGALSLGIPASSLLIAEWDFI